MKELRNLELFGDGKLVGYRTDDGVLRFTAHYDKGKVDYIRIETPSSGNHAIIATQRLDEALRILTKLKESTSGTSVGLTSR